jgi:hypothetical protein
MNAKNTSLALGVIFFVSVTAIVLPVGATIRVVAAIPAAGSLCAHFCRFSVTRLHMKERCG